jgi:hypothetical protein
MAERQGFPATVCKSLFYIKVYYPTASNLHQTQPEVMEKNEKERVEK